jgi:metallo-beta-lactamase class B
MFKALLSFILVGFFFASKDKPDSYASENLRIEKITENTYLHVSYIMYQGSKVDCNGLVYIKNQEAIIADTPNDSLASEELIHWLEKDLNVKVKAVVGTHFHSDCLGGLGAFKRNGIPSYVSTQTQKLSVAEGMNQADYTFENQKSFLKGAIAFRYFGAGHTADNIVAYVPSEKLLFGGCLIKTLNASKGYLGDANLASWPNTVQKIKKEYPDLKHVIPGHGAIGGRDLFDYTIELFSE